MSLLPLHFSTVPPRRAAITKTAFAFPLPAMSLIALLFASMVIVWVNLPWATGAWQFVLFTTASYLALASSQSTQIVAGRALMPIAFSCGMAVWGAVQLAIGHAAYNYNAVLAVLSWTTLPAGLLMGMLLLRKHTMRDAFLMGLWFLSVIATGMELYQLLVLGRYTVLPSGLPLMSSNLYAELVELLLPAVLATSLRKGSRLWLGCTLCVLMLGTTIAAGARMGTALLLVEAAVVFYAVRKAPGYRRLTWKKHGLPLALLLISVLALEGTTGLTLRLQEAHPMEGRTEILKSSLHIASERPVVGWGMGSLPVIYPQFAAQPAQGFVNHVHNDYLEITVEGGLIGLALWLAFLVVALPAVLRAPWSFGVFAILIHSMTDFPLYRSPVIALFAMLVAAAVARAIDPGTTNNTLLFERASIVLPSPSA